jgi:hypothetical protein
MTSTATDNEIGNLVIASGLAPGLLSAQPAEVLDQELAISARTEIVFIEDNVADLDTLIQGIAAGKEVIILDSTRDGLSQIAAALEGRSGIDALHIISHGAAGTFNLGELTLNAASLNANSAVLQAIGSSLTAGGDILLYGCDTGAGSSGASFVEQLAIATGADVAASDDLTGSAALGGDWELEVSAGQVEVTNAVDAKLAAAYQQVLGLTNATVTFTTEANFVNRPNNTDAGNSANLVYKVNGSSAYQLVIDAASTPVTAYLEGAPDFVPNSYANIAGQTLPDQERTATISFLNGQVFTISSLQFSKVYSVTQTLKFTGYDVSNNAVATASGTTTDTFSTLALSGFSNIVKIVITTDDNSGYFKFFALDNLVFSDIHQNAPAVTSVTSSTATGSYNAGDQINITVNFDAAVDVTGTPQLKLETGTTDRVINYVSGTGSSSLIFTYTVQAGDTSADLDYFSTTALTLNGGTIKASGTSTDATLTLPTPGTAGSLGANKAIVIDTTAPAAPSVPDLDLTTDSGTSNSDNVTTNTSVKFAGTAESGATVKLYDTDGITEIGSGTATGGSYSITVSSPLASGTHTITAKAIDAAGNVSSASSGLAVTIDTTTPTLAISSNKSTLKVGETATITFTFSEDPGSTFTWSGSSGDVVVSGGTLSAISGSGLTRTAIFTPTANTNNGTASITVPSGAYTDAAGNNGGAGATPSISFDTKVPNAPDQPDLFTANDSGSSSTDNVTAIPTPAMGGFGAEAGSTVKLYDTDGVTVVGTATANAGGVWSLDTSFLSEGQHTLTARAIDAAGNVSAASTSLVVTIDYTAPGQPAAPDLASASDSGASNTDNITNSSALTFSGGFGSAEANATIDLYDGATKVATTTAAADGQWQVTNVNLSGDGTHTISVKAVDTAGNASFDSGSLSVVIDRTAPVAPATPDLVAGSTGDTGRSSTDNITKVAVPTFSGAAGSAAGGSTVRLYDTDGTTVIATTTAAGDGSWSVASTTLAEGVHTITAKATDAAGNVSPASAGLAVTIDLGAPSAPSAPDLATANDSGSSSTDNLTNDTTALFSGDAEAGATITLYDTDGTTVITTTTANGSGNWSVATTLSEGTHVVTATATDAAGNGSARSPGTTVTIDRTLPVARAATAVFSADSGESSTDLVTKIEGQTISGTLDANLAAGEHVEVSLDNGGSWNTATASVGSDTWSIAVTLAGSNTLQVRLVDEAGNASTALTRAYVLDTTVPAAPSPPDLLAASDSGTSDTDNITGDTRPTFTGTAADGLTVKLFDGGIEIGSAAVDHGTWSITSTSELGERTHYITAMAVDTAGNAASSSALELQVVTTGPATSIASLRFSGDTGTSNTDFITSTAAQTISGSLSAALAANERVQVSLDGGTSWTTASAATGSSNWSLAATLGTGTHTVVVRVTDAVDNSGPEFSQAYTLDTAAPAVTITSSASQLKVGETATITFTFSEDPGATFSWDGSVGDVVVSGGTLSAISGTGLVRTAVFTPDAGIDSTAASITVPGHSYADTAGNTGSAGATPSLTFDTLAPNAPSVPNLDTSTDSGDAASDDLTHDTALVLTGSAENGATVTLYDSDGTTAIGHGTASGGTWTITTSTLGEGAHTITARAVDAVGNASAASSGLAVTIDTTPPAAPAAPDLLNDSGVSATDNLTSVMAPTFSGTAEARATVVLYDSDGSTELGRDVADVDGRWSIAVVSLSDGAHSLTVKATDVAGNTSAASASLNITYDTRNPDAPLVLAMQTNSDTDPTSFDNVTNDTTPTFSGTGVAGAAVTLYDGATAIGSGVVGGDGTWTIISSALAKGSHSITATQSDDAGNDSLPSSALTVHILTDAPTTQVVSLAISDDSGTSATDFVTNVELQTISGKLSSNLAAFEQVQVSINGVDWYTASAATGSDSWSITASLVGFTPHVVQVRVADQAGNAGPVYTQAYMLDTGGPGLSITSNVLRPRAGETAVITFTFTEDPGATFTWDGSTGDVTVTGGTLSAISGTGLTRTATFTPLASTDNGMAVISVAAGAFNDVAGNASYGLQMYLDYDTLAPSTPSAPTLKASSDTGTQGDGATTNTNPVIEGTALPNTRVTLYDAAESRVLGVTTSDASGHWSITASGLASGLHALTVTQTDAAGNVSAASAAFALQIDALVDGMPVRTQPALIPGPDGTSIAGTAIDIPIVTGTRAESAGQSGVADIPLLSSGGVDLLLAQLAPGYGLSASGANLSAANAGDYLIAAILAATPGHAVGDQGHLTANGESFLAELASSGSLLVETVTPISSAPDGVLTLSGPGALAGQGVALVIESGGLAAGSTIVLQDVDFAAVIGAANVVAGSGSPVLTGDAASQHFTVQAGTTTEVYAGAGNDILSFAAPASGTPAAASVTVLQGGEDSDVAAFSGALADFNVEYHNGYVLVSSKAAPQAKALVVNVEQLQFSDTTLALTSSSDLLIVAGLYETVLGRQADLGGFEFWSDVHQAGASWGRIALDMLNSSESTAANGAINGNAAHDVGLLYQVLFNRAADAGGLAYWTDLMSHGTSLEQVANALVQSAEMVGHQRAALDWNFYV